MEVVEKEKETIKEVPAGYYHDYCELLKAWFGDNIDTKVVESAINFWFKDDDYKSGGSKVYKYFREA